MPGTEFGRYSVERKLGEGAMGAVYLARDSSLGRRVALKIPKLEAGDLEGHQRFLREARTAAALSNPHICPIHDVGELNGTPYLTMLYIDGRPLSDYCNPAKPVQPRSAAIVIRKLALALAEAHDAGVIHRDLKPENVMVDRKGEPVVMDFGLARSFHQSAGGRVTQSGVICGSPAYMSPEQIRDDQAAIGPASDIYSLGVILYELITGKLPFDGSVGTILAKVLTEQPPPPRGLREEIDAHLESICLRMLAKSPDQRFGSMRDVAAAITSYLALPQPQATVPVFSAETDPAAIHLETVSSVAGRSRTSRKNQQRRILLNSTACLFGLIAFGTAAVWMLSGTGAPNPENVNARSSSAVERRPTAAERIQVSEESADEEPERQPRKLTRLKPLESSSEPPKAEASAPSVQTVSIPSPVAPASEAKPSIPVPTEPSAPTSTRRMPLIYVELPKLPRPGETIEPETVSLEPPPDVAARFASGQTGRWSLIMPEGIDRKILVVDEPGKSTDPNHPHRIQFKLTKPFEAEQQAKSPPPDVIAECQLGGSEFLWTWALTKDLDVRGVQNSLRQCVLSREDGSSSEPVLIALQRPISVSSPISLASVLARPDNRLPLARYDRTSLFAPLEGTDSLRLDSSRGNRLQASYSDNALRIHCPSLASQAGLKHFVFVISPSVDQVYGRIETDPSITDASEQLAGAKKSRRSLTTRLNQAQANLGRFRSDYLAAERMSARNNSEQTARNSRLSIAAQGIARSENELAKVLSAIPGADNLIAQKQSEYDDLQRRSGPINDVQLSGEICRMVGDVRVVAIKLGATTSAESP